MFSLLLSKHIRSANTVWHSLKTKTVKILIKLARNICFYFLIETDTTEAMLRVRQEHFLCIFQSYILKLREKNKELQSKI